MIPHSHRVVAFLLFVSCGLTGPTEDAGSAGGFAGGGSAVGGGTAGGAPAGGSAGGASAGGSAGGASAGGSAGGAAAGGSAGGAAAGGSAGGAAAGGSAGGAAAGGSAGGAVAGGSAGGAVAGGSAGGASAGGSTAGGSAGGAIAGGAAGGGSIPDGGSTGLVPLTDFTAGQTYKGFPGFLYPGANTPPANHRDAGLQFARSVVPLDRFGQPSDAGAIVLMSIGMSNTTQEWCSAATNADGGPPCDPWTFTGQALADPQVDRRWLRIVDGARSAQTASAWDMPTDPNYDRVRDERLATLGLAEAQVQVLWIKLAIPQPTVALPAMTSDARTLQTQLGGVLRSVRVRYPNLKLAFLSSRLYAGFATSTLNPEPYAYETGFSVKWTVEAQLTQAATGTIDSYSGNLAYPARAPWTAWGPYPWADGLRPRGDGLIWTRADFEGDGTHPSTSGEQKVGTQLLNFFKSSPATRCWFLNTMATCP